MLDKELRKRFDRNFVKYGMDCFQKACLDMIVSYKEEGIDVHYTELEDKIGSNSITFHSFLEDMRRAGFLSWEVKIVPGENNFQFVWDLGPLYETLKDDKSKNQKIMEEIEETFDL